MQEQRDLESLDLTRLLRDSGRLCSCGRYHSSHVKEVLIASGALARVGEVVRRHGGSKVFIIADKRTFAVAGEQVCTQLAKAQIEYKKHIFQGEELRLDSGEVILNYDPKCDLILAIGTGTIGDLSKIVASVARKTYVIVATAPSMDGFASGTSSVILNRTKASIVTCEPTAVIADLDILCQAPMELLQAGLGDMIAKYISICEWRISQIITGEYYCEEIASLVRRAVRTCANNAEGLRARKPESVEEVFKSLVFTGVAMSFTGLSRPASGVEHYFSHLWDMRAIEFGTDAHLHGIQCGTATLFALRVYGLIQKVVPDRQRALNYAASFDLDRWNRKLVAFLGKSAQEVIEAEKREGKYDQVAHAKRLDAICQNWEQILAVISEELPKEEELLDVLRKMDLPLTPQALGLTPTEVRDTFTMTKDIRDKYVASRLVWDLGVIEEVADDFLLFAKQRMTSNSECE